FRMVCVALCMMLQTGHPNWLPWSRTRYEPYRSKLKEGSINGMHLAPAFGLVHLLASCLPSENQSVNALQVLMRKTLFFEATDPRDSIYALLGLCTEEDRAFE